MSKHTRTMRKTALTKQPCVIVIAHPGRLPFFPFLSTIQNQNNMSDLTFDDYKNRISIQEVLKDAGYQFYRRDGLRWPCYIRLDDEGRRIRGDKFIVCGNDKACFQPPQTRRYNVISFIAEHPEMFPEGRGGKDPYAVVNEVCHRILNMPMEYRERHIQEPKKDVKPFALSDYKCEYLFPTKDSVRKFQPFFGPRGISVGTMGAFEKAHMLTSLQGRNGAHQNLSFPMRHPATGKIIGLEQRGLPDAGGKSSYKGMAKGSNATEGVWLACPNHGKDMMQHLSDVKDVHWFESAYDAMAFYQMHTEPLRNELERINDMKLSERPLGWDDKCRKYNAIIETYDNALYVSTGGTPSRQQLKGVLERTPNAGHHVCFDNDKAGHIFAVDLLLTRAGHDFQTSLLNNDQLQIVDHTEEKRKKYILNLEPFEFDRIAHVIGIGNPDMGDYVKSLADPKNPYSGDFELLPSNTLASTYYNKIEKLEEQQRSGELYWGVPPDERKEVTQRCQIVMNDLLKGFKETIKKDFEAYKQGKGYIDILTPPNGCKDWNEVIMDKRQYDEQDTISTFGDNGEVYTEEVNQDHEESVRRDDDEKENIRHHCRR